MNSTDPFTLPNVDLNGLSDPRDLAVFREAIKAARRLTKAPAWEGSIISEFGAVANATTDEEIEEYIRNSVASFWHGSGTAKISSAKSNDGVVGPDLKVKGVKGLRVVDASVFVSTLNYTH